MLNCCRMLHFLNILWHSGTIGEKKKNDFENLKQWWEVGKTQIKLCCQQYTAYCTTTQRETIKALERDIESIETEILRRNDPALLITYNRKRNS